MTHSSSGSTWNERGWFSRLLGACQCRVWQGWQQRFAEDGAGGLLREKTRKPGKPPEEATHWTSRAMAKAAGLSLRTVHRIWEAHKLQPHRVRTFKRSRDPDFGAKLSDIVGLYMNPPT